MTYSGPTTGHLLKKIRGLMQASSAGSLSAYIVPSGDAHQSEYIADCDARRAFITKFTGSNGTAVITIDKAALWTDGRYHLQASKQIDPTCWTLMRDGLPDTPTQEDWLKDSLNKGSKVGVDPLLLSQNSWKQLSKALRTKDISLVAVKENLIDLVWEERNLLVEGVDEPRPKRPNNKLIKLDTDITGKDWALKVSALRQELQKKKAGSIILTALDDIAWLLNLRGSDISFNPVFFSYCIVTGEEVFLFIDKEKLTPEIEQTLRVNYVDPPPSNNNEEMRVNVMPYEVIEEFIQTRLLPNEEQLIWISNRSSHALVNLIPSEKRCVLPSPVGKQKAIKNDIEIQNMKNCHIRDGAALCEYLAWLEKTIEANPQGHESLWEIQGADYLEKCRKAQEHFMGLSFPSISSSGPNGAIIHYHPEEATRRPIGKSELYLIDSGAQYLDGTTDVTRTVHFGTPSEKERECFTLVLKGHIKLALAVFPPLVKASSLDSFARQALWSRGLEYLHGTGHGVGMFLNVHEGPASISPRPHPDDPGLEAGWILSNEPGYYENGSFGIRIENLVVTKKVDTKYKFNNQDYLKLETITLAPIQLKMIDINLLTDDELDWLNGYHATCRQVVGEYLEKLGKQDVKQWLIKETQKLERSKPH